MKNIIYLGPRLFIALCLFCTCPSFGQRTLSETDLERFDLRGKVKSEHLVEYHADSLDGKLVKGAFHSTHIGLWDINWLTKYNRFGYRTEVIGHPNSERANAYFYTFDRSNKLLKIETEFDVSLDFYYGDTGLVDSVYAYGFVDELTDVDREMGLDCSYERWRRYTYNDKGELIEKRLEFDSPRCDTKESYKYDSLGYQIEVTNFKSEYSGGDVERSVFSYDSLGNVTQKDFYKNNFFYNKTRYEYDRAGNKLLEIKYSRSYKNRYPEDHIVELTVWTYGYYGNIKSIKYFDAKNDRHSITKYQYKYDDRGNWIERIEFNGDTPKFIQERTITYYD